MLDEEHIYEIMRVFLNEIRDFVNYDICNLSYVYDDMSYATVLLSCCKDEENNSRFQDKLVDLTRQTHKNLIKLMAEEKQAVIFSYSNAKNSKEDKYEPFIDNIKNEAYIPFFNVNATTLMGCLYLGSYDPDNVFKHGYLIDKKFLSKLMSIKGVFAIIYDKLREEGYLGKLIHVMDDIVGQRDPFMINHHYNVANWVTIMADELNLSKDKRKELYTAAVFHDIGKLYISESILNKKGKLSDEEYNIIKKHPKYSHIIVNELLQNNIAEIVKYHHERYDGKGYPEGLKGESIPFESRILAISDAVDAMLSHRSYKKPKEISMVINEIVKNRSKQFDPEIADVMVKVLMNIKKRNIDILSDPNTFGTMNIVTKAKTFTMQGTIIPSKYSYIFQPYKGYSMEEIKQNEITDICFFTEVAESIYEYEVKLRSIRKERMYIIDLLPVSLTEYFNMIWDLKGVLSLDSDNKIDVEISKISGNSLMFAVKKEEFNNSIDNKTYRFDIYFEDSGAVSVTGKIIRRYEVGYKAYCVFKYVNIPERMRDIIIKHIFRKQGELRRSIVS